MSCGFAGAAAGLTIVPSAPATSLVTSLARGPCPNRKSKQPLRTCVQHPCPNRESPRPHRKKLKQPNQAMAKTRGGGGGLLNLEQHYAFYGAYHSNPVNVAIHALFVWPIFLTAVLLLHLTAPFPHAAAAGAALYGAFYLLLDRRAGALAALLCFLCWAASAALAARLGFSTGCKVVLVAQLFCWTMQFIGHGVFEKRAPALLDNLVQAFLMAPFFVLLEVLQRFAGYEPYHGFHANVDKLIVAARKEWQDKKAKKSS